MSTRALIGLLLTLALAACVAPSQHDESRYGVVHVALAPSPDGVWDWSQNQRAEIRAALQSLAALGPTFVEVMREADADVILRDWSSGPHCEHGAGQYTLGSRVVEVDPVCAPGLGLRAAVGHEIMHAVTSARWGWVGHICRHVGETSDCHPTIYGLAVLNPRVSYGDVLDQTNGETGLPQDVPTAADLALFERCITQGCR